MFAELKPVFNRQKSFNGKALVFTNDMGMFLISYTTIVAGVLKDGRCVRCWGGWSATTGRHVREFFKQETGRMVGKNEYYELEYLPGSDIKYGGYFLV